MILTALHLRRFRGLDHAAFTFARGVNVIVGPNEAGKSTLRAALRTAMYSNPATTSPKVVEDQTWGAAELPVVVLEFEVDGKPFILTKDFSQRKASLTDSSGRPWEQYKVVQERMGAALGLATEALFDATAQVVQAELERTHLNSIAKELGQKVSGAGEDVITAIRRLDQAVKDLERGTKGLAKEPGLLLSLEERVKALQADAERLRSAGTELERKQQDLARVGTERAALAETLATTRALLEANRDLLRLESDAAALRREEAMLDEKVGKIETTLSRIAELDKALETATASGVIEEETVQALRLRRERIAMKGADAAALRAPEADRQAVPSGRRSVLAIIAAVFLIAGAAAYLAGLRVPGIAGVIAGALAAGVAYASARRAAELLRLAEARRLDRQARLATVEAEEAQERVEFAEHLRQTGCVSLQEAEQRLRAYRTLADDRRRAADLLAALREGSADETIVDRRNTLRRDLFVIDERLNAPDSTQRRLTPLEFQSHERDAERLAKDVDVVEEQERRLGWEVERLAYDAETLASLEEQAHEAGEALAAAHNRLAVYKAALDGLTEARRQAEVEYRQIVETRASEYVQILSEGRYKRLQVERGSMKVVVWSDEAGGWVEPKEPHLSRGTVDLVYLSVRLALVDVLAGGKHPPLLLDDPFVTFDDTRRAAAARLLKELSRTHQVFLFTCNRHFDAGADLVIDLPLAAAIPQAVSEPAARTVSRPEAEVSPVGPLWDPSRS